MGYIEENMKDIVKAEKKIFGLARSYMYWVNNLFERTCRIFEWAGLPFEQHELETRVLAHGWTGEVDDGYAGIIVTHGSMHGVTEFADKFSKFTYAGATLKGGTKDIGKDCVIIKNTALKTSILPMIERYADMLAHAEISMRCALIEGRKVNTYTATDDATAESIRNYDNKIYLGEHEVIVDSSLIGALANISKGSAESNTIKSCWDIRQDILRSFYNEIGVRYSREKKERLIEAETNTDAQMLLLNINDMLKQREQAAREMSEIFGLNVSVKLSKEFELIKEGMTDDDGDN